jgi:F-type H+-transporting ATPase subunit delta
MPPAEPSSNPFRVERYADALVALGEGAGAASRVESELPWVADFLAGNEDVRRFMADPLLTLEGKRRALEDVLGPRVHPVLLYFLFILLSEGALRDLSPVVAAFFRKVSSARNRVAGEIVSSRALDGEKIATIEKETGRILGKEVQLRVRVDPSMLGGVLVRVGDFVLDATVEHQLDDIHRRLLA